MPKKHRGEEGTVKISKGIDESLESFLKSQRAREIGLDSKKDIVNKAVLDFLERYTKPPKQRFQHINKYENHTKILDRDLERCGRIVSVYFKDDRDAFCDYCQSHDCVHIDYAWEIPAVGKILRKKGVKSPSEKRQAEYP